MLEAIATSDWHLNGLNKHFINGNERILHEVDKIYQYAIKNGVKYVIVPGDISDTPDMGFDAYIALVIFLKKYDGIIETHYIAGNHDFSDIDKTSMDLLQVLVENGFFKSFHLHLNPLKTKLEGIPVNFLPYPRLETLSSKKGALNFAHVEYTGAIGDNGRTLKTKHELQTIEKDFTISGHIHQYQTVPKKRAIYCGNPFQKNFGEALPKGFIHFKASSKNGSIEVKHKFVDNRPSFILQNIDIENISDLKKLKSDDNVRYKLRVGADIVLPSDILLQYPNITGGIFYASGKKASIEEDLKELVVKQSKVNLETGLKRFLSAQGFDKRMINEARSMVKEAKNQLGI